MTKNTETQEVKSCGSCPFMESEMVNRCGKMPYEKDRHFLPVFSVNSDWRAPIPEWCPLRKRSVLVFLAKG